MPTATDRIPKKHTAPTAFTAAQKQQLRRRLLAWYADHARDLPWRKSRDPYRVWVSEIMLQQTQVATVREYFNRFIAAFPTVDDLAAADEQKVLRLWEGLGYYRRARQLHAAAKRIVADHASQFPQCVDELQSLPGIGRYTAGAIASIAFDLRARSSKPTRSASSAVSSPTATTPRKPQANASSGKPPTTSCRARSRPSSIRP